MSVTSDSWADSELKGSSALRLAQSFRRASTTAASSSNTNRQPEVPLRRPTFGVIEPPRKSSLAGLPLRLRRSRTKTVEDVLVDRGHTSQMTLADMFFSMPNEIQAHILCQLEAQDILSLRLASHSLSDMVQFNASAISRSVLRRSVHGETNVYLETLYPQPRPLSSLDYFVQMLHRQAVVDKMVLAVTDFVQYKIYQIKSTSRQKQFAPVRRRMLSRLKTPAFIICHYLETLRAALLASSNPQLEWWLPDKTSEICWGCVHLQCVILQNYPVQHLLPTLQFFRIMLSAFRQKLQPPTYAGSIERRLRGWNRDAASDSDMTKVILLGGMRETHRIMSYPKYIPRLAELRRFVHRVDGDGTTVGYAATGPNRTSAMRALDLPDLSNTPFQSRQTQSLPPPSSLFQMGARSRVVTAAILEGTVETQWSIPDAFTFIKDIIADRETRLGESEAFDPNVNFELRAAEPDDEDEGDEQGEGPMPHIPG